jgi:hypothetical protein
MKNRMVCNIGAAVLLSLSFPAYTMAQAPLQLSVINPIQLVSGFDSIRGLSLGLVYTVNDNMTGLSYTLGANKLTGDMKGIQMALVNMVDGDVTGYQSGVLNCVNGDFEGWQNGFINLNHSLTHGLQTGLLNMTGDLRGLQFGWLNMTNTLYGVQLGLINLNSSGEPFGFLPIINWGF